MSEAPTPITYEDVVTAAHALVNAGEKASTLAVREKLGRGSFTTIKKHLDVWRADQSPAATPPPPVPPQLESLWSEAQRQAVERLTADREALDALATQLDQRHQAMEAAVQEAENARHHAEALLSQKDAELARLAPLLDDLRAQRERAEQARQTATKQLELERAAWTTRLDTLHSQLTEMVSTQRGVVEVTGSLPSTLQDLSRCVEGRLVRLQAEMVEHRASDAARIAEQWAKLLERLKHVSAIVDDLDRRLRRPCESPFVQNKAIRHARVRKMSKNLRP